MSTGNLHVRSIRGSGLSTCMALDALSRAVGNPMVWIPVRDHQHSEVVSNTREQNDLFKARVKEMADKLGLEVEFQFNSDGMCWFIRTEYRGAKEMQYVKR